MKTKSLSIFLVALFVVEMNLGAEEGNNENKEGEKLKYEKMGDEHASEADFWLKTILIGNSEVGKSALSEKICKNTFPEVYSQTIGFDFSNLIFRIVSDENKLGLVLKYQIWDCCGSEYYRNIITSFYNKASVVLLVYDVTNVKSFNDIDGWVNDAKTNNTDKTIHFVLIGNKIDLNDNRKVTKETGKKFAEKNGMKFVEVSAKTGAGIKDLENILAKIIYEESKKDKKKGKDENNEKKDEKIVEDDSEDVFGGGKEHTHSSSLCDCCKKICENC